MNQLYYGDNLHVLREHIASESVDLIYLDPPFNSKRDYNLLFKSPKGQSSDAQIEAFKDSWSWGQQAENELHELMKQSNTDVALMMDALIRFLGRNDMTAYLVMMANRLIELHRVLKSTGSLYLHCDPTASHYLKIVLDGVFGKEMFRDELIWKRADTVKGNFGQGSKFFDRNTDSIFFYVKTDDSFFNPIFKRYTDDYIATSYRHVEPDTGRRYRLISMTGPGGAAKGNPQYEVMGVTRFWRYSKEKMQELIEAGMVVQSNPGNVPSRKLYLDEGKGVPIQSLWDDIPALHSQSAERLGYPTQKPLALLERIISASSKEGDVVLDPFCGCGTAVHAAQKLKRNWIGIDITHLAISLIEKRLKDAFGARCKFEVHGTPKDFSAASDLAARDKYQFQWWAVSLVDAQPFQGKKKGADTGIDGLKFFYELKGDAKKIVISVKGGALKSDDIRALNHVREREKAEIGLCISLHEPTPKMRADAASAGIYDGGLSSKKQVPRIQLLTIDGLLSGKERAEHPDYVPDVNFKKAKRESDEAENANLFEEGQEDS